MKKGEEIERQKMHAVELPISQLTAVYLNSQKTKPPYSSPHDFCLFAPHGDQISPEIADVIYSLRKDNLLPNSVAAYLPWDAIPKKSNRPVAKGKIRILRTKGVWAIAPELEGNFIFCPLAVIEKKGTFRVQNPDNEKIYEIEIEEPPGIFCRDFWWLLKSEET